MLLSLCLGNSECNNLSFTLDGIYWHAPNHWDFKYVFDVADPESSHAYTRENVS